MASEGLNNPQYLMSQYRGSVNLDIRVQFHKRFSTNQFGWSRWVFDQIHLPSQCRILELGCGTGGLWRENLSRIPRTWNILLTDFSAGMLRQAGENLAGNPYFEFKQVNAEIHPLPFRDASFEAVIANHVLPHITTRQALFSEIRRMLKPDGHFYASTVGKQHLIEITALISEFDSALASWGNVTDAFNLENGGAQLTPWFNSVNLHRYQDSLVVNEAGPLVDYISSGWLDLGKDRLEMFKRFIEKKLEAQGGALYITKDSGIFEAA